MSKVLLLRTRAIVSAVAVGLGVVGVPAAARAGYELTTLASFAGTTAGTGPNAGLTLSGATLYGTLYGGTTADPYGEVFSEPITGGTPTVLAAFNRSNGAGPHGTLTVAGGTVYGTTIAGGTPFSLGTVFSVPAAGGNPTQLASFSPSSGNQPASNVVLVNGILYGTTRLGGAAGDGIVFSVPATGGTPTVLATFNGSNGANPSGDLAYANGVLYGTTYPVGGAGGYGEVFSVPVAGGTLATVASFNAATGAASPLGLTLAGNVLYGATAGGLFTLPVSGGSLNFARTTGNGPTGSLTVAGGLLYGVHASSVTDSSGKSAVVDSLVSVPLAGGTATTLATFTGPNGTGPVGDFVVSGGEIYGATQSGGPGGGGTVFAISTTATAVSLTTLAPTTFGSNIGTLAVVGGQSNRVSLSDETRAAAFVQVTGVDSATGSVTFGLDVYDPVPADAAADLAALAAALNASAYGGYAVTASTVDLTGVLSGGYDFYVTVGDPPSASGTAYFGVDLSQVAGVQNPLSFSAIAAATVVPEPAGVLLMAVGVVGMASRRRVVLNRR